MSHKAVNWALEQTHLKPGPWIVLIKLGDRHNRDTKQVNPEQATLAADCNMSRATINRHLDDLEEMGLLKRVQRQNPATKKRLSTFYILGLDFASPPRIEFAMSQIETREAKGQTGNTGQGHVSNCDTDPCLKNGKSRVSKSGNPVSQIETGTIGIEPVREPCASDAAHTAEDLFEEFAQVYPRLGDLDATKAEMQAALDAGVCPKQILAGARAYAAEQAGNSLQYVAYSQNWIRAKRWEGQPVPSEPASQDEIDAKRVDAIKAGKSFLIRSVPVTQLRRLVSKGLVSEAECRAIGVPV